MNVKKTAQHIRTLFERSDYFEYVVRATDTVAFDVGGLIILVRVDEDGGLHFTQHADAKDLHAHVWVEVSEAALEQAAETQSCLDFYKLRGTSNGKPLHRSAATLVKRMLEGPPDTLDVASEREDVIFPSLFGPVPPRVLWQSESGIIQVLCYPAGPSGTYAWVTSGLTDPKAGSSPLSEEETPVLGRGYELCVLADPSLGVLGEELITWAQYIEETGNDLLPGNWLETDEDTIPGTDLAGFLVLPPFTFPERFPLGTSYGFWHVLMGVTKKELAQAKEGGSESVAKALAEAEILDVTQARR